MSISGNGAGSTVFNQEGKKKCKKKSEFNFSSKISFLYKYTRPVPLYIYIHHKGLRRLYHFISEGNLKG